MKLFIHSFLICLLLSNLTYAQLPEPTAPTASQQNVEASKNQYQIPGLDTEFILKLEENSKASFENKENFKEINFQIIDGKLRLKNKADNDSVLAFMNVPAEAINKVFFKQDENLLPLEKMLNAAKAVSEKAITLQTSNTTIDNSPESTISDNEIGGTKVPNEESALPSWLLSTILGLVGIGIGYLIGKGTKSKVVTTPEKVVAPIVLTPEEELKAINVLKAQHAALEKDLKNLKAQNNDLQSAVTAYNKTAAEDQIIYQQAFNHLIEPLRDAIIKGNQTEIVNNSLQTAFLMSSFIRLKQNKRTKYDEPNLNYLISSFSNAPSGFEVIDKNTPLDKIPKGLKAVKDILQQYKIEDLRAIIIDSYQLKNL